MLIELQQIASGNIIGNIRLRQFVDIDAMAIDLYLLDKLIRAFVHAVQVKLDKQRMGGPRHQVASAGGCGRVCG